jgi:hypothetical protein
MDLLDRLLEEADVVRKECFAGGSHITVGEALAFMLGVPIEHAGELLEVVDLVVDSRMEGCDDDDRDLMRYIVGCEMGVAAQRINAVRVP